MKLLKRLLLVFCVVSAMVKPSFSQSYLEDSLSAEIFATNNPHKKIKLMGELSYFYQYNNSKKAMEIAKQAHDLALSEAKEELSYTNNLIGISFLGMGKDDSALFYFQETYNLAIELNDSLHISKALNNQAAVFMNMGEYEIGLDKISESAKIDVLMGNVEGATTSYLNLGGIYIQLQDYEKARMNLEFALDLAIKEEDRVNEANVYLNFGALEINLGNFDDGKTWFFSAIEIQKELNDLDGVVRSYNNLAYSFRSQGKYKIALVYDFKSLEYAEMLDSPSAKKAAYQGIANSYEKLGQFEMALNNYKYFMSWQDTVQLQENRQTLIEMQEKYNSEQTLKENEILQQQNKIESLQNKENKAMLIQSRLIIISVVVGLLLLVVLAVVLYNRNRIRQKANLELQVANEIIQEKNNDITASIEYASKIQEALLPTKENEGLFSDSFFILMPKDIVSGDFLWYSRVGNRVVFTAADCTGHGVPGAFMSMIGNTFLHQIVNEKRILQPSDILDELRARVITALSQQGSENARKDGMDMALCVLDLDSLTLEYSGANNPVYYINNGEMKEIKPDKQPVGYMPERPEKFTNHKVQLSKGDSIYIFSDGYADQFGGPKGKKFKYKQLRELLFANSSLNMTEQKSNLLVKFKDWKGDLEQIDDVCLMGVRV